MQIDTRIMLGLLGGSLAQKMSPPVFRILIRIRTGFNGVWVCGSESGLGMWIRIQKAK
jgi:hypothetical protein